MAGKRHGKGRIILDGNEEPMRTWQNDNIVIAPDNTQGRAYEIHNASQKVNLEKYQKLMEEFVEERELPDPSYPDYRVEGFISFVNKNATRFSDNSDIQQQLDEVLDRFDMNDPITKLSFAFLFAQPDDFIEFYIKAFVQDCYHAYGNGGMSCVNGIKERVYMIIGDAAFSFCPDPENCDNPYYVKLLKIFHKHIDKNDFTKEWANQITPEIQAMSTTKRKRHYVAFMKKKYQDLDMYNIDTRKLIKTEADKLDYVFDKEKNPDMTFGGQCLSTRRRRPKTRGTRSGRKLGRIGHYK